MLGREVKDMIEGEHAVSYRVGLVGISVVLGCLLDRGECSEDELERGVPLIDLV
jgi:hypothetical protein